VAVHHQDVLEAQGFEFLYHRFYRSLFVEGWNENANVFVAQAGISPGNDFVI
jgi:riboflavin biosynthesis pyrimidine reductase